MDRSGESSDMILTNAMSNDAFDIFVTREMLVLLEESTPQPPYCAG